MENYVNNISFKWLINIKKQVAKKKQQIHLES